MIEKIVSGGQTGADRAALDFAMERGIAHGGWCPKGRLAEDGVIHERYRLRETSTGDYAERTEKNVQDSDGTVIFTIGSEPTGGSRKTAEFAQEHGKPWIHLSRERSGDPADRLEAFLERERIAVLNVAGSRASEEPQVGEFVRQTLASL